MSEEAPTISQSRAEAARSCLRNVGLNTGPRLTDFADTVLLGLGELGGDELSDSDCHYEIANEAVPDYTRELLSILGEDIRLAHRRPEMVAEGACIEDVLKAVLLEVAMEVISDWVQG